MCERETVAREKVRATESVESFAKYLLLVLNYDDPVERACVLKNISGAFIEEIRRVQCAAVWEATRGKKYADERVASVLGVSKARVRQMIGTFNAILKEENE